ncbi:MAG TPA: hypothetical protein VNW97_14005 [Candidatus Saccharimonadales bacterium]|jgi:D-alanine-D-alanine ligase|nr:hypothetical protein [Candidatus Saccharimonadales bacterium]
MPNPKIRVLYLANYAPIGSRDHPSSDEGTGSRPEYHGEIFELLSNLGLKVESSREVKSLIEGNAQFDYVFSLLNRAPYRGSEILVSSLCEYYHLPYLGARPHVRAVAEDKLIAKTVARQLGFPVPQSRTYHRDDDESFPPEFRGPYIAKLRCGAASKHLTENCIQDLWEDLIPEVRRLREQEDDVLVEQFVPGTNISLPVIGGDPLVVLPAYRLLSPKKGQLVTFEQKRRIDGGLERKILDDPFVYDQLRAFGVALYQQLRPLDYLRVDFRLTELGVPVFLEFNVCCNISSKSGFYMCAKQTGMSYREMIVRILRHSFQRQEIDWQPL